ncbi:MAG: DUF2225 domain-containing protein [Candidatus Zixiibacteriota bacterium]
MTSETPVFLTKIECPICKTINEFETIKVGAYTEADRDTDFCPKDRTWRNPRYQVYNPLLFFSATCSHCYYTREFNNSYKEWKTDSYFKTYSLKTVKENHLQLLAQSDSVIKKIGAALDSIRYPNETAIMKLILAIIDESFYEKPMNLDLGRFYLRIGWIFREMERSEDSNVQIGKGHLIDADNQFSRIKRSIADVSESIAGFKQSIQTQFDDETISAELKSLLYQVKDKYDIELASFLEMLSLLDGKIEAVDLIIKEHRELMLGNSDGEISTTFHNYNSFYDFLCQLRNQWATIPRNEKEALTYAVEHYVKAFADGKAIGAGNQQIQASYLIAELSRRIGENEQAKEYFNKTIRTGQEFVHKHKHDKSRTALAKKILELAIEQARENISVLQAG